MVDQNKPLTGPPDMTAESDGKVAWMELLCQAQAGDLAAFETLMRHTRRRVYLIAMRLTGQSQEAQDVSQEVFLRFYRSLSRVDPRRDPMPWLYRITVNVCRDLQRRHRSMPVVPLAAAEAEHRPEQTEGDAVLDRMHRLRLVEKGLRALPVKEREALVLRDIEGRSTAEVARILGTSETTVRSQVCRGRWKIKRFVERLGR